MPVDPKTDFSDSLIHVDSETNAAHSLHFQHVAYPQVAYAGLDTLYVKGPSCCSIRQSSAKNVLLDTCARCSKPPNGCLKQLAQVYSRHL